ncbi:MAG: DEAD/DEAH box helicase [Candidatus Cloacimonadaceae bacterium]|nr:DEAD/DEAH box helicase [Candidatus Cloacimonadaceae bacterium]
MARLFSKDYHDKSASWYFNHAVIALADGDLEFWKSVDEQGRFNLHFFAVTDKRDYFSARVDIVYDKAGERVISHTCSECKDAEDCRHYLSILRYSYHHLKTEIFSAPVIETCDGNDLRANESWQNTVHAARFELEGIYNPVLDKIRFYHGEFDPIELPLLIRISLDEIPASVSATKIEDYQANLGVFSDNEIRFLQFLHIHRSAYSAKGRFYSIYKKDFAAALGLMMNLGERFRVRESGEMLQIFSTVYPLSLRIEARGRKDYIVYPVIVEELSICYSGYPSWLFFRNQVRPVYLPFRGEVIEKLMSSSLIINSRELVYYRTVVYNELRKHDIYLDIDNSIELPYIISEPPRIKLKIKQMDHRILLEGKLSYLGEIEIPLSVVRFQTPLIKSDYTRGAESGNAWFYLPPDVFDKVRILVKSLPGASHDRIGEFSQLVFEGDSALAELRQKVFEMGEKDWDIEIDPALNREFIHKVPLQVEISARRSDEIEWFEYDISYKYRDFSFTHDELKRFFRSKDEFIHTVDGKIVFVENREAFDEVERLLAQSERKADGVYRARMLNLPYYQKLMQENTGFRFLGDDWLNHVSKDLVRRHLDRTEPLPQYLQTVLRGYQKTGYAWLKMLQHYHLNGILADEMGLGKTIQSLAVILSSQSSKMSLLICPKTLLYNWAAEIEKFHTNIPYLIVEGGKETRREMLNNPNVKLLIISYSVVLNDVALLRDIEFEWIVLDEAQNIKNVSAQRTNAIKKLKSAHRMALSGTPVENNLTELWSIFDFLMPGYLGTLNRFKQDYLSPENPEQSVARLHRSVSPFILRRVKKEVLLELPDKQEQVSWCKLNPIQEKLYLQILEMVRQKLFPASEGQPLNYIHILAALTKLRQVCNHPHLANNDILPELAASAKLEQLVELVQDSIDSGHKVLVFSQFVQMLKIAKKVFDDLGIAYSYLDGQTKNRMQVVNDFESDPAKRLFLISLKTGGTGLNLTSADTVILFDPWWNPMVENQAIDRTHRIGQTRKVQVFRLISKGTVEEKIMELQKGKLDMFEAVMSEGQQMLNSLSFDEVSSLFDYR